MNFKEKIKSFIFQKGHVTGLEFHNDEIHIKVESPTFKNPIKIRKEDITFFSYSKRQPFVGIKFLGIRTRKGNFIYRSETMEKDIYPKLLEFLGVKRLKFIRRRAISLQLIFASVLFVLEIIFYHKAWGNIPTLLSLFGALNVIGAIYNFISIQKNIRDLLGFQNKKSFLKY